MKFTSRDLLCFGAFIATALAAMRTGGLLAAALFLGLALAAMAAMIVALVDRSARRAFAIGFLVPLVTYAGIHAFSGHDELDPWDDFALPTTQSFRPLYLTFRTLTWIDGATGDSIPDYDPTTDPSLHSGGGGGGFGTAASVTANESPDRSTFSLVVHSTIAVTLSVVGAKFASYIHRTQDGG